MTEASVSAAMDAKWLVAQFARTEKSQADLARYLNLAPPIINKMVKGKRKILATEADAIRRFFNLSTENERVTNLTHRRASADTNGALRQADANITVPLRTEMVRDLPILGVVSGGPGGLGQLNDGTPMDYALRPPRLIGRKDVAGFFVEDPSMAPAHMPGSLVVCEKNKPPKPGDDIVFELLPKTPRDERRALIKRLVSITSSAIKLEQFNPPEQLSFPRERVVNMMRVIPLNELLGV